MEKKEKISVEEINLLEKRAKKERLTHRRIMRAIDRGCAIYDEQEKLHSVDEKTMLEIVERSRKDEIKALLERYKNRREPHYLRLPSSVQMKLYQWLTGGKTGVSERTIKRDIAYLQSIGLLRRVGGRKEGHWVLD